jgi:acetone carboxylase gamma subunit
MQELESQVGRDAMNELARICPLCGSVGASLFHRDRYREYFRCPACGLVHVPGKYHLSPEKQKCRYDLHQNNPRDEGYRSFLARLLEPLVENMKAGAEGLDYGSGPVPVLSMLLSEKGFKMSNFDPFYAADLAVLDRKYDFVTCCETAEHFSDPAKEWKLLFGLARKGGRIAVMTQWLETVPDFPKWHYINDATHVCFYSRKTLEWLADKYCAGVSFHGASVALFRV